MIMAAKISWWVILSVHIHSFNTTWLFRQSSWITPRSSLMEETKRVQAKFRARKRQRRDFTDAAEVEFDEAFSSVHALGISRRTDC